MVFSPHTWAPYGGSASADPRVESQSPSLAPLDAYSQARYLEQQGRVAQARMIYSQIQTDQSALGSRVMEARAAMTGSEGLNGARLEFLADRFVDMVMDPAALGAMAGAGLTYRLSRAGFLRLLSPLASETAWAGRGLNVAASGLAFGAEATAFPLFHNGAEGLMGHEVDWSASALRQQIQSSFLVLGGLKAFGLMGRHLSSQFAPQGGVLPHLIPQVSMYLGIVSGRLAEQHFGLAPQMATAQVMAEALGTAIHFNGMGRILGLAHGPGARLASFPQRQENRFLPLRPVFEVASLGREAASPRTFRPDPRRRNILMMSAEEGGPGSKEGAEENSASTRRRRRPSRSFTPLAIPKEVYERRQAQTPEQQNQLKKFLWSSLLSGSSASRALKSLFPEGATSLGQAKPRFTGGPHLHTHGFQKLQTLGLVEELPGRGGRAKIQPTAQGLEAFRFLEVGQGFGLNELQARILARMNETVGPMSLRAIQEIFNSSEDVQANDRVHRAVEGMAEQTLVARFQQTKPAIYLITTFGRERAAQWHAILAQSRRVLGQDLVLEDLPPAFEIRERGPDEPNPPVAPTVLIRRGISVRPEQMVVSMGAGSMLTTRGSTRATRSAAMLGPNHPETLAHLAEDFRLVRYQGRDDAGRETWVRADNGKSIDAEEIAAEFGERLRRESGIRPIPLAGEAQNLPVGHGALIPEAMRTGERLLEWMAMSSAELKGTALQNQFRNYGHASHSGIYGLWAALAAHEGLGFPLHALRGLHPSRYGMAQGTAAPGIERWTEMYEAALQGKDSTTYKLQSALLENARGIYLNTILPHLDFREVKKDPRALERILPTHLGPGEMPRTGGVNAAFSQACAAGLYALWGAHRALVRTGIPGEYPMDAMMVMGVDATFAPYETAPMVAGFSRRAPATLSGMMSRLREQGRLPEDLAAAYDEADALERGRMWHQVPEPLRIQAMNESSAPFTRWAQGLVVGEAAAAMPWMNFDSAIRMGLWPSSRLLGIGVNSGEGGGANLASMDQGIVTAIRVALNMTDAHGTRPGLVQAHGTSTALNNIAELKSLIRALDYQGISHPIFLNGLKGLVGHPMGAASAVDMVMGVQTLLEGRAPGLFNFRTEDMDPRYAEQLPEALERLRFPTSPVENFGDSLLILSEGFLSSDAAAVLGAFPRDVAGAAEMLRDYGFDQETIAAWKDRAPAHREASEQLGERLRRGDMNLADIALHYGFNP